MRRRSITFGRWSRCALALVSGACSREVIPATTIDDTPPVVRDRDAAMSDATSVDALSSIPSDAPADRGVTVDAGVSSGALGVVRREGESVTLRTHPTVNYRGVDAAYDPARRRFLVVYGNAPIGGATLDDDGVQVGDGFRLTDEPYAEGRWTQLPRVAYGADGFLVTWHAEIGRSVVAQARRVALDPGGPVFAGPAVALDAPGDQQESPVAVAFSPETREFMTVWAQRGLRARRVNASGAPVGASVAVSEEGVFVEQPSVTYHPASRSFFVVFMQASSDGARVLLRRLEDGTARPIGAARDLTGALAFAKITDAAFDAHAGEVIATWYEVRGTERGFAAQRFRADGEPAGVARPVFRPHHSYDGYDLAWSAATGTSLAAFHGPAADAFGAELDRSLAASEPLVVTASGARNGLFLPRVVAHPERPWWLVLGSADYARVVAQRVTRVDARP